MFKKVSWKRLLLTRSQKFLLDLHRLGSKDKPDKVERFIIFLEGLAPSALYSKLKRYGKRALINTYWHLTPKKIKLIKSKNPFIVEFLPWFSDGRCEQHLYRLGEKGKILISSSGRGYNKEDCTYSWKKAYYMVVECSKEMKRLELQSELNSKLRKKKEGNTIE